MTPELPDPRRVRAVEAALKAALEFIEALPVAEAEDFETGRRAEQRRRRVPDRGAPRSRRRTGDAR